MTADPGLSHLDRLLVLLIALGMGVWGLLRP